MLVELQKNRHFWLKYYTWIAWLSISRNLTLFTPLKKSSLSAKIFQADRADVSFVSTPIILDNTPNRKSCWVADIQALLVKVIKSGKKSVLTNSCYLEFWNSNTVFFFQIYYRIECRGFRTPQITRQFTKIGIKISTLFPGAREVHFKVRTSAATRSLLHTEIWEKICVYQSVHAESHDHVSKSSSVSWILLLWDKFKILNTSRR